MPLNISYRYNLGASHRVGTVVEPDRGKIRDRSNDELGGLTCAAVAAEISVFSIFLSLANKESNQTKVVKTWSRNRTYLNKVHATPWSGLTDEITFLKSRPPTGLKVPRSSLVGRSDRGRGGDGVICDLRHCPSATTRLNCVPWKFASAAMRTRKIACAFTAGMAAARLVRMASVVFMLLVTGCCCCCCCFWW